MPLFSPSGRILSGEQVGAPTRDQWGWYTADTAIGYRYTGEPGLSLYSPTTGIFARLGTYGAGVRRRFFAVGAQAWLSDLTTGAIDSAGRTFPDDRSACGLSAEGDEVFVRKADFAALMVRTSPGGVLIFDTPGFNNAHPVVMQQGVLTWGDGTGRLRARGAADPSGPPGGDRRFTTAPDGSRWIAGYVAGWGLCAYRWVSDGTCQGYVLSEDGLDYYPDLWAAPDGVLQVASAETQADTGVRHYELDLLGQVWRRNEGAWQPLAARDLFVPPLAPIPVIGRPCWLGWFTFGAPDQPVPANCDLRTDRVNRMLVRELDGTIVAVYAAGKDETNLDDLNADVRLAQAQYPGREVLAYWPYAAQPGPLPLGTPLIEAYRRTTESSADFGARLATQIVRTSRCWLAAQAFSSNADLSMNLRSIPRVVGALARDFPQVGGILAFSAGPGRATGWDDHPEMHEDWQQLMAGVSSTLPPIVWTPPVPPDPPVPPTPPVIAGDVILMADTERPTLYYYGTTPASRPGLVRLYSRRDQSMIFSVERDGTVSEEPAGNNGYFTHFQVLGQAVLQNAANPGEADHPHWFPAFDVAAKF